jgi:hypothetical protein
VGSPQCRRTPRLGDRGVRILRRRPCGLPQSTRRAGGGDRASCPPQWPTRAKSDPLDAVEAAREALSQRQHAAPRAAGEREALRVLVKTREGAVLARTAAINQLRALVVAAPEPLRSSLRGLSFAELVRRCERLRPQARDTTTHAIALALRSTARRIAALTTEYSTTKSHSSSKRPRQPCSQSQASGRSALPASSSPGPTMAASAPKPPSQCSPAPARSRPRPGRRSDTDSTAAAIANSTEPYTRSRSHAARQPTARRATTSTAASATERQLAR